MTEQEQRIAIMEELGWSQIEDRSEALMMPKGTCLVGYPAKGAILGKKQELPDPLHDLNVMAEVENTLSRADLQHVIYVKYLFRLCGNLEACAFATASQRAEAFLRTIGKWKY